MTTDFNLLPAGVKESYAFRRQIISQVSRFAVMAVLFFELLALLSLLLNLQAYMSLKLSEKRVSADQRLWQENRGEEESLRAFQKRAEVFREVNVMRRTYSVALKTLTGIVPDELVFNQLKLSGERVRITAQTASVLAFASFIEKLLVVPDFREVVLTESEYLSRENVYQIAVEIPLVYERLFR